MVHELVEILLTTFFCWECPLPAHVGASLSYGIVHLQAGPWLRQMFADLAPQRTGHDHRPVFVGFVVVKVTLGEAFLRVLRFPLPVSFCQCSVFVFSSTFDAQDS